MSTLGSARTRHVLGCCLLFLLGAVGPSSALGEDGQSVAGLLKQAEVARSSDPAKLRQLLTELTVFKGQASPMQQDRIEYLEAYAQAFSGQYASSIEQARNLFENSSNPEIQLRAGLLIVNIQAITRQFADGMRQLELTMPLMEHVQDPEILQQGFGVAATIHNLAGQHARALEYAERILEQAPEGRTLCFAQQSRLEALFKLERLLESDAEILSAIQQCVDHRELVAANTVRITLAKKWAAAGQVDQAIDLLRWHIPEIEARSYPYLVGDARALMAELLLARGDVGAAGEHAQRVAAQREHLMGSLPLASAYRTLYQIAESEGDAALALEAYRQYAEADKAYLNEVKARELAYQTARLETEQMNQQIERLNQQNQLLKLQREVDHRSSINSRLLMALLLLVLAFIALWAFRVKRAQVSLRALTETDVLTGVATRHHFTAMCESALVQYQRDGTEAALIMFDLDHFKLINDRHGHATGDRVLSETGHACLALCRPQDVLGRLGGEEFAVFAPGMDLLAAVRFAESLRLAIMGVLAEEDEESGITASFGVVTTSVSGHDLNHLLSQADQALYKAKAEGRNRICIHDQGLNAGSGIHAQAASNEGRVGLGLQGAGIDA